MNAAAEPLSPSNPALMANALRMLSVDAVEAARSGHPGMPLGMADIAVALWDRHLRHNPANPQWADRDRFVLLNGHCSRASSTVRNIVSSIASCFLEGRVMR